MKSYSQGFLLGKVKTYLKNHGRASTAEQLSPGYCAGLTVLFLYLTSLGQQEKFERLLTHVLNWSPQEDTEIAERLAKFRERKLWQEAAKKLHAYLTDHPTKRNLSYANQILAAFDSGALTQEETRVLHQGMLPDDPEIEKLFGLIEWIQRSMMYQDVEFTIYGDKLVVDTLHDSDAAHHFEKVLYESSLILNLNDLEKILKTLPANCPIFLGTFSHAIAIYKSDDSYKLYDANYASPVESFSDAGMIAKNIYYKTYHCRTETEEIPLKLRITSHEKQDASIVTSLDRVVEEIRASKPIDHHAKDGTTALLLAAKNSQAQLVKRLIAAGHNVNAAHVTGLHAIHLTTSTDTLKLLLDAGADVNHPIHAPDEDLQKFTTNTLQNYWSLENASPLYVLAGCQANILEELLRRGADVNHATTQGLTPLMHAAMRGNLASTNLFLQHGAEVTCQVKTLARRAIGLATMGDEDHAGLFRVFGAISHDEYKGYNAAMLAASFNHTDVVMALLQAGTDPSFQNENGECLMTIAAEQGNVRLLEALLARGASAHQSKMIPQYGLASPLYLACRHGHIKFIEGLLTAQPNINPKDSSEIPTIVGAALSNNSDIINLLYNLGAKLDEHFQGSTPLQWALQRGNMLAAECLFDLGAKLSESDLILKKIIKQDHDMALKFILDKSDFSTQTRLELLNEALTSGAKKCMAVILENATLLADSQTALTYIQEALSNRSTTECAIQILCHCFMIRNHSFNFDELREKSKSSFPIKKLTVIYFQAASQGEPLNDILLKILAAVGLLGAELIADLKKSLGACTTVDEAIANLPKKYVGMVDDNSYEILQKFVSEIIAKYPPEIIPKQTPSRSLKK